MNESVADESNLDDGRHPPIDAGEPRHRVVIAAGGVGVRMGHDSPKQVMEIQGKSLLHWTLLAFEKAPQIHGIILVLEATLFQKYQHHALFGREFSKIEAVVQGGEQRMDSVRLGLAHVEDSDLVLIHDAVRPFVSGALINRCLSAGKRHSAAIPVVPPVDTVKRLNTEGVVKHTEDRDSLAMVQTPQVFWAKTIKTAHQKAFERKWKATDDASLVERCGEPVHTFPGDPLNIKITRPQDMIVARCIAAQWEKQELHRCTE